MHLVHRLNGLTTTQALAQARGLLVVGIWWEVSGYKLHILFGYDMNYMDIDMI